MLHVSHPTHEDPVSRWTVFRGALRNAWACAHEAWREDWDDHAEHVRVRKAVKACSHPNLHRQDRAGQGNGYWYYNCPDCPWFDWVKEGGGE